MPEIKIGRKRISDSQPTYFIADIAANHDGDLERAKQLIELAKEAGADAAKFQNFSAGEIVSDHGFKSIGSQISHQSSWQKSVFEVYQDASIPWEWTPELKKHCAAVGIDYFSAAYDFGAVDMLEPYVDVYKIGSGDITWIEILEHTARKNKPMLLATGAAAIEDVVRAVDAITALNPSIAIMQCNTNYTGSLENLRFVNLNVLKTYRVLFPNAVLGLSDHTPGHATVLGAVTLGARIVEKHFTDDTTRTGPDHGFSMDPQTWSEMVQRTRELEAALGDTLKRVEPNEQQTVVIQRRCLRAAQDLEQGAPLTREMIQVLRPAPADAIFPYEIEALLGKKLAVPIQAGDYFKWDQLQACETSATSKSQTSQTAA